MVDNNLFDTKISPEPLDVHVFESTCLNQDWAVRFVNSTSSWRKGFERFAPEWSSLCVCTLPHKALVRRCQGGCWLRGGEVKGSNVQRCMAVIPGDSTAWHVRTAGADRQGSSLWSSFASCLFCVWELCWAYAIGYTLNGSGPDHCLKTLDLFSKLRGSTAARHDVWRGRF